MSEFEPDQPTGPRRRADAERSIAAILDGAVDVLSEQPRASMDEIARAAGVARQTVYAHYASRDALLDAVQRRALEQAVAAIDATEPERGPPAEALDRLIAAGWQALERHARLIESFLEPHGPEELQDLHRPILERLDRLVKRGQRAGAFDRKLPRDWLLAAVLALFHATAQEVGAGRMSAEDSAATLRRAVPRLLDAEDASG